MRRFVYGLIGALCLLSACARHSVTSIQYSRHAIHDQCLIRRAVRPDDILARLKQSGRRFETRVWEEPDHQIVALGPNYDDVYAVIRLEPWPPHGTRIKIFADSPSIHHFLTERIVRPLEPNDQARDR